MIAMPNQIYEVYSQANELAKLVLDPTVFK